MLTLVQQVEPGEDLAFQRLHRLGVVVVLVVIADQMQEAVHREMTQMMLEGLGFLIGFPPRRLIGNRDVAEHARHVVRRLSARLQCGKRQHIGRLVDAAPVAVQRPDAAVVGQHHRKLGIAGVGVGDFGGGADGAMDHGFRARLRLPAAGGDEDFGLGKGRACHHSGMLETAGT